jgi:hypothetical protein
MTRLHAALGVLITIIALLTANAAWSEPRGDTSCVMASEVLVLSDASDERGMADVLTLASSGPAFALESLRIVHELFVQQGCTSCPPYRPPD